MIITLNFLKQVCSRWRIYMYLLSVGKDQRANTRETISKGKSAFLAKFYHFAYRQLHSRNSRKKICQGKGKNI